MMMKIKTCVTIGSSSMQTRTLVYFTTLNYWPSNPIPPPEEAATQNNERFVMADKLDQTKTFEDANHPAIPDMMPIPFIGEREEFDTVNITDEEINNTKDSNGTIQFMNVMR